MLRMASRGGVVAGAVVLVVGKGGRSFTHTHHGAATADASTPCLMDDIFAAADAVAHEAASRSRAPTPFVDKAPSSKGFTKQQIVKGDDDSWDALFGAVDDVSTEQTTVSARWASAAPVAATDPPPFVVPTDPTALVDAFVDAMDEVETAPPASRALAAIRLLTNHIIGRGDAIFGVGGVHPGVLRGRTFDAVTLSSVTLPIPTLSRRSPPSSGDYDDAGALARTQWIGGVWSRVTAGEGCDLQRSLFRGVIFDACVFTACQFDGAVFYECSFVGGTHFARSSFRRCVFSRCTFETSAARHGGRHDNVPDVGSPHEMRRRRQATFLGCDFDLADVVAFRGGGGGSGSGGGGATSGTAGDWQREARHSINWGTCRRRFGS